MKNLYFAHNIWKAYVREFILYEITFDENIITMVDILNEIYSNFDTYLYFNIYSVYSDSLGTLGIPWQYSGNLIVPRGDRNIILEADMKFINKDYMQFVRDIFFMPSTAFICDIDPKEIQFMYFNAYDYANFEKYFKHLKAYIDFDNDATYMKIYVDPKYKDIIENLKNEDIKEINKL